MKNKNADSLRPAHNQSRGCRSVQRKVAEQAREHATFHPELIALINRGLPWLRREEEIAEGWDRAFRVARGEPQRAARSAIAKSWDEAFAKVAR